MRFHFTADVTFEVKNRKEALETLAHHLLNASSGLTGINEEDNDEEKTFKGIFDLHTHD